MLRTQSLIGGLNMCKGYAMYYHVEMYEISRVNLQIGLHNEKVQDVCGNFMEHRKKRRASGELYSVLWYVTPPLQSSSHVICMSVLLAKFLTDSYYELF